MNNHYFRKCTNFRKTHLFSQILLLIWRNQTSVQNVQRTRGSDPKSRFERINETAPLWISDLLLDCVFQYRKASTFLPIHRFFVHERRQPSLLDNETRACIRTYFLPNPWCVISEAQEGARIRIPCDHCGLRIQHNCGEHLLWLLQNIRTLDSLLSHQFPRIDPSLPGLEIKWCTLLYSWRSSLQLQCTSHTTTWVCIFTSYWSWHCWYTPFFEW